MNSLTQSILKIGSCKINFDLLKNMENSIQNATKVS